MAVVALVMAGCAEASQALPDGLEVVKAQVHDVSPRLSELAKLAVSSKLTEAEGERAREANPPRRIRWPRADQGALAPLVDPSLQTAAGTGTIPSTIANFEGMGTGLSDYLVQSAPPDPIGDVGPSHFVQTVNFSLAVFSRSGQLLLGPVPTRALWSGFDGACSSTNDGDATVRYDHIAGRWVIAQFSVNGGQGPFFQCVAVSTSGDPLGTYNRYQFGYAAFNDYPKMALWIDAYYFTFNLFQNNEFVGAKACAMDRNKMLAGGAATMHCFNTGPEEGGLLASDLDGKTHPAKGTPAAIATFATDELLLWRMHADFSVPAKSYFLGPVHLPVIPFRMMCDGKTCVKQPSTTQALDAVSDRPMNRMAYRRFPAYDTVVFSHSVTAGISGGVRWYEVRNPTGATPVLHQQGTYAPDSAYRFMSSIAMDAVGNIALGYAVSSGTVSPGVRYTGRLATDPLGTFGQGEGTIVEGFGAQVGGLSRFGDYSSLNVDPVDDCTFWYTQEYIGATGSFNWRTRVGSFKFPNCGAAIDDFTLVASPGAVSLGPGQSTDVLVETKVTSGAPPNISLSIAGLPTGVVASFTPTIVTPGSNSVLRLTASAAAPASTAQVLITGTTATTMHSAGVALTVRAAGAISGLGGLDATASDAPEPPPANADGACATGRYLAPGLPVAIPDNAATGARATIDVAGGGDVRDALVSLDLAHPFRGDLQVALISPGGKRYLLSDREGKDADDLRLVRATVPGLAGQPAGGRWRLEVRDLAGQDTGELRSWQLELVASCDARQVVASQARPLPLIDRGVQCSSLDVADVGDAADLTLLVRGRHSYRSSLRAELRHGGRSAAVLTRGELARGPGELVFRVRPELGGSATGAWTLCVEDLDGYGDTGELTSWQLER